MIFIDARARRVSEQLEFWTRRALAATRWWGRGFAPVAGPRVQEGREALKRVKALVTAAIGFLEGGDGLAALRAAGLRYMVPADAYCYLLTAFFQVRRGGHEDIGSFLHHLEGTCDGILAAGAGAAPAPGAAKDPDPADVRLLEAVLTRLSEKASRHLGGGR